MRSRIRRYVLTLLWIWLVNTTNIMPCMAGNIEVPVHIGGRNSLDFVDYETREDVQALEIRLTETGYIRLDESTEDYNIFVAHSGNSFVEKPPDNQDIRVYVYQAYYDAALKETEEYGYITPETTELLEYSAVTIDYFYFDCKDRAGKVSYEFNDGIKDYQKSGYMKIISPVSVKVTLQLEWEQSFFEFYVRADTPLLVKVKEGRYYVTSVNNIELKESGYYHEDSFPYNNIYWVGSGSGFGDYDAPCVVDLGAFCIKYKETLIPLDLEGKPDYSLMTEDDTFAADKADMIDNGNKHYEEAETEEEKSTEDKKPVFALVIVIIAGLLLLVIRIKEKRYKGGG